MSEPQERAAARAEGERESVGEDASWGAPPGVRVTSPRTPAAQRMRQEEGDREGLAGGGSVGKGEEEEEDDDEMLDGDGDDCFPRASTNAKGQWTPVSG